MADIKLKQQEVRTIKFTITEDDVALDVSTATFEFKMKKRHQNAVLFTKEDADFDTTDAASGIVRVTLSSDNLNQTPGFYIGELKVTLGSEVIKSNDFSIELAQAIT